MAGDDKPADDGGGKPEAGANREGSAGRRRGYRGNRGDNRRESAGTPRSNDALFTGRIEALKGYIYDCSDIKQAEMFTKTTKEITHYVAREFGKGGDDVRRAIEALKLPEINKPDKPDPATSDEYDKIEWSGKMKNYQAQMFNLEEGMKRLFSVVYGQCTKLMIARLAAIEDFEADVIEMSDMLGLLNAIKRITFNF